MRQIALVIGEARQKNAMIPRKQLNFVERSELIAAIRRVRDALRKKKDVHGIIEH